MVSCPLALLGSAFYPVLVHRLAASLRASFPHSVSLVQLRFASFAVINLRRDLHPQECAHAGRTKEKARHVRQAGLFWKNDHDMRDRLLRDIKQRCRQQQ